MSTQNQQILAHLKSGKVLTSKIASRLLECERLAARIHELRRRHRIHTAMLKLKSGKRCAVYSL